MRPASAPLHDRSPRCDRLETLSYEWLGDSGLPLAITRGGPNQDLDTTSFEYDPRGNLTRTVYHDGVLLHDDEELEPDRLDQVHLHTLRHGYTVAYTYDTSGQVLLKDYASASVPDVSYSWSPTFPGRIEALTDRFGTTFYDYESSLEHAYAVPDPYRLIRQERPPLL